MRYPSIAPALTASVAMSLTLATAPTARAASVASALSVSDAQASAGCAVTHFTLSAPLVINQTVVDAGNVDYIALAVFDGAGALVSWLNVQGTGTYAVSGLNPTPLTGASPTVGPMELRVVDTTNGGPTASAVAAAPVLASTALASFSGSGAADCTALTAAVAPGGGSGSGGSSGWSGAGGSAGAGSGGGGAGSGGAGSGGVSNPVAQAQNTLVQGNLDR
ncbi:MAG: hypothetical protein AAF909_07290, partial [Pseudomonadota bacterium]